MLMYVFHYFIVWWDIRHHRRRCQYYSMEVHTQCWQGLSHIRPLVDVATDGEQNVVTNLYKLVFTPWTTLIGVIKECQDIPYQHRAPFVSFTEVPQRLLTPDNVVGTYSSHSQVCYVNLCMHFFWNLYNVFIPCCSIDIIAMVVALSLIHIWRCRRRG